MTSQEQRNPILKGRQAGKSVSSVEALRQKYYTQTEAIIARIREVCPELMELREGCEVAIEASPSPLHLKIIEPYRGRKNEWLMTEHMVWYENIERAKIIGHPVHLEHLLRAIGEEIDITPCSEDSVPQLELHAHFGKTTYYDLTLTVEQNLEQNEALREWVYELICK